MAKTIEREFFGNAVVKNRDDRIVAMFLMESDAVEYAVRWNSYYGAGSLTVHKAWLSERVEHEEREYI